MPPSFTILSGVNGFAVVVPDFSPGTIRKAARVMWESHVTADSPFATVSEFSQLCKSGQQMTWYQYADADPDLWGERWGEDGDLRENPISVIWFVDDDIPGRYAWE